MRLASTLVLTCSLSFLAACNAGDDLEQNASDLTSCAPPPACEGNAGPDLGEKRSFAHATSNVIALARPVLHRGRDQMLTVGQPQWIIGKFAYSIADKDLKDEEVDIFVERGCSGRWEKLGTARTTDEPRGLQVEGVDDAGGRVFFQVPADKLLPEGRHRVRLVVAGDHTYADLVIDVAPANAPIVVSDVDGTLTSSESADWPALLTLRVPDAQPQAADALRALANRGYRIVYLTARSELKTSRTRDFLRERNFPPGIVNTSPVAAVKGLTGDAAYAFKTGELRRYQSRGLAIRWAFGNRESDAKAFEEVGILPKDQRVFLQLDATRGGRSIAQYSEILPALEGLPRECSAGTAQTP